MSSQPSSKPKLLVVDDEPDNIDLLYRTFHREYKVLRAENGPDALQILAKEAKTGTSVAVIISDQRMPMMSGTEFLSLTATQYPDIIRIILTGYTDLEDLVEAINAGKVFKYVTKPWNAEELKAVVRQAMDTHNVLKVRTEELTRTLRRESLLNTVTNTIRNAQYSPPDGSPLKQILQTIVDTVGHMLVVNVCILRPFQDNRLVDEYFVYKGSKLRDKKLEVTSKEEFLSLAAHLVWETHDVEVINDVETDERFQNDTALGRHRQQAYLQAGIRSSLTVPLICQQELMAVIALHQGEEPRLWQDDEIQLVVVVADQAALAISQARAYEQVHALATREALVNTITTAIRSSLDPQEIFAAITQQLGKAMQVDGCVLSLWKKEDEYVQPVGLYDRAENRVLTELNGNGLQVKDATELKLSGLPVEGSLPSSNLSYGVREGSGSAVYEEGEGTTSIGMPNADAAHLAAIPQPATPSLPQSVVPIAGNPVLQLLLKTKQPVAIEDLDQHPEMIGLDLPLRAPARALLVVPLVSDGKIIGSITLRQTYKPRRWQPTEIDLAQAVAAQAAIAVQQSWLYQKTRQLAERLLELDRQKTEFFQNISHEFRTPLTLMMGPLEQAVNQQQDLPLNMATIALRNSRRLLRLVNQLLDLQRLDAGHMQASFRPCNLVEFVERIVETFRPYCEKKELHLESQLEAIPLVYLDLERFDKVLYNLLSNAMKFTPPSGRITVRVKPTGDHVRLQIVDTGIGIRPEQIPYLFERFRQAEGSVNRSYEGSGLGLALVKELVELHGGQISVESIYTQGTAFTVWLRTGTSHLPLEHVLEVPTEVESLRAAIELADLEVEGVEESYELNSEVSHAKLPEHCAKILVVDDNPDLRSYVSSILQAGDYQVILARNGDEGFRCACQYNPDLIVTDLMMPLVSGIEMIRMIREHQELKGKPIILLTAKVDEETRIEGTERGADAYLAKPFNDRELLAEVRNLLALKENEQRVVDLNNYLTESVLRRFLPSAMVEQCAKGELILDLRPEPRLITVLFSDIVGFTSLANTLRSRRVAELLNQYLEAMTKAVFDNGGTVDKFMGDAILALFGAPEDLTPNEQIKRAIASAKAMHRSLAQLNQKWQEQGILGGNGCAPVQFRCGIHQGTAVVGMFGSAERSDYTAIGPTVNIASRLQEVAQPNTILVSAAVADYLEEDEIIKCDPLRLKGIDETVLSFMVKPEE